MFSLFFLCLFTISFGTEMCMREEGFQFGTAAYTHIAEVSDTLIQLVGWGCAVIVLEHALAYLKKG